MKYNRENLECTIREVFNNDSYVDAVKTLPELVTAACARCFGYDLMGSKEKYILSRAYREMKETGNFNFEQNE